MSSLAMRKGAAKPPQATTKPLGCSSTTKGSNRCAAVAEGQTEAPWALKGRATRPTGADAAKQVTASCDNQPRRGASSTTKGSNRNAAALLRQQGL